jgi:hypothetical protein
LSSSHVTRSSSLWTLRLELVCLRAARPFAFATATTK